MDRKHGVGKLIRELRDARGWSQGNLADALTEQSGQAINRESISRWESCKHKPSLYWLRHLASVLDVPLAVMESDVDRRKFLASFAATAVAPGIASDLLAQGFTARLQGEGPSVDQWGHILVGYGADYMTSGAADIQKRLAVDLAIIQQQCDTPRMWAHAARLMTLFAKTFPGSDGAKAVQWYRMAAESADRSGDVDTRVWVRGRAAIALGYEGASLPIANMFADQALEISDRPTLGRLNAIYGKSHSAAITGDHDTARALDTEGRRVFDQSGSEDAEASDYAVPYWRLGVFRSLLRARLGDESDAIDAQDEARRLLPPTLPRFATHLEMHRGLMLVRAGDRDGGTAYARAALEALPPEKHSLTLRMLMDEIETPGNSLA
ncbi:helix-turn-helix transcriptional regulator [Nocardia sp. NPDC058519]|uniref:helix-turn-helix transcriptional regulator n=1 Tax=Nocardia sp. NPDC058519 TaxID=3346535 RepID=UPI003665C478